LQENPVYQTAEQAGLENSKNACRKPQPDCHGQSQTALAGEAQQAFIEIHQ
jgi:hypothetical protein